MEEAGGIVSPTSIRSRILKAEISPGQTPAPILSFTHVDPFEDTESRPCPCGTPRHSPRFTHVDPFEDTESALCSLAQNQ